MNRTIPLLSLALGLSLGLTGCETVSDAASGVGDTVASAASALDPTNWFGGDETPPAPDQTASSDTNANTAPDLASLPARPPTSTPAQQQAAAQSLAQDGTQARYSADTLRAGTETAAAPPPAADVSAAARLAANNAPPTASAPPPSAQPAASDLPPTADAPPSAQPMAPPPTAAPRVAAAPPPSAPAAAPPAPGRGTPAVPAVPPAPVRTAALEPSRAAVPPGAEPAVPAVPAVSANTPMRGASALNSQTASDAALGFRPSAAPPLDPSINEWVSPPILARYRQTASSGGVAPARQPAVPPKGAPVTDMSGGGAVIANMDAISTGTGMAMPSSSNNGVPPTAVIMFPSDGTVLSAAAKDQIKQAAARYRDSGGLGSIRVVGHSSSRTANMPVEKHLEMIFEKSQERANAVGQELIRDGVPADRVLIEAVGDSQPVYFESMPQGEEGNRRAEIFVQS